MAEGAGCEPASHRQPTCLKGWFEVGLEQRAMMLKGDTHLLAVSTKTRQESGTKGIWALIGVERIRSVPGVSALIAYPEVAMPALAWRPACLKTPYPVAYADYLAAYFA